MPSHSVMSSIALKKTLQLFLLLALVTAGISVFISDLFSVDLFARAETTAQQNLAQLWSGYKRFYIDRGRVVRPKDGNDTVSEGQAYAMIRALWQRDRETFDEVYRWTEENLSRTKSHGDHLLSWRYGIDPLGGGSVMDGNSAIDADLDYALALFLASKAWPDGKHPPKTQPYREKAVAVAESIMDRAVVPHPTGELVLLPWPKDESTSSNLNTLVNPSYFSPGHYRVFELETGNRAWGKLADDTYRQLSRLIGRRGDGGGEKTPVVPDWIVMRPDGGFVAGQEKGFVSSWDAFRLWWRLRVDYDLSKNLIARELLENRLTKFLDHSMELAGGEVATASDRDGVPTVRRSNPGMLAVYFWALRDLNPAMSRMLQRQAMRFLRTDENGFPYFDDKRDYYTNSWAWWAANEVTTEIPFVSLYRFTATTTAPATEAGDR